MLVLNHPAFGGFVMHCKWKLILRGYERRHRKNDDNDEKDKTIQEKAKELGVRERGAPEKGGSSYDDIGRLVDELMAHRSSGDVRDGH
ncbi:hypothetical protein E2562_008113 [Oryza meyeriana var. granulata]|uniref:Uncharacterized protein n=1 Tax=Oryza meyeriana var. granulata TaxID=110450 RepID=A0A6G1CEA8_9ORYZ|nr:hypothetical protein E2562_008113 [Oryza meyeriana var. granulata]